MSESEKRFNEGRYSTLPKSEFPSGSPEWEGAQIRDTIRQRNEKGWGQWNQQISGQSSVKNADFRQIGASHCLE